MTRIVLARHGESEWHRDDRYAGVSDIDLTDRGRAQAEELGAWAATAGLAALITSPLRRCQATAAPVAAATGLEPQTDSRLIELDFGIAEGKRRDELIADHAGAYHAFRADPVAHHFPDGEDPRLAAARFVAALADLSLTYPDDRVLVVAHSTVTRLALCTLLGVELSRYRTAFPKLGNGCVSEIRLADDGAGLLALNLPLGVEGDPA